MKGAPRHDPFSRVLTEPVDKKLLTRVAPMREEDAQLICAGWCWHQSSKAYQWQSSMLLFQACSYARQLELRIEELEGRS